jgi:hypothetical protein
MSQEIQAASWGSFERIRHIDEQGSEYWLARELMLTLGYDQWRNFQGIVREARQIYLSQGGTYVEEVFGAVAKNPTKSGGRPSSEFDYRLTRHACYLVAMSADGTKDEVAAAKTYFAVKTHLRELDEQGILDDPEQEYADWRRRAIASYRARGYDQEWAEKRVDVIVIRNQLTHEWSVRGIDERDFEVLTDRLHMGTFGLGQQDHLAIKGFPVINGKRRGNLDDGSTITELAFTTLSQALAIEQHQHNNSHGLTEISRDIDTAARAAAVAREAVERITGIPVVSPSGAIPSGSTPNLRSLDAPSNPDEE